MIAELRVIRDAVTAAGVPCWVGQVPDGTAMPYASLSAPGYGTPDDLNAASDTEDVDTYVRLMVVDTNESNVLTRLERLHDALAPRSLPVVLTMPGRAASLQWWRHEGAAVDRDVTLSGTNRHPAVGTDTYRLSSQPA